MANSELLQVVPLAIYESRDLPEDYKTRPPTPRVSRRALPYPPITFKVSKRYSIGEEFAIVPALGISNDGIDINHADEVNAASLGRKYGWIGYATVASRELKIARKVLIDKIVPYSANGQPLDSGVVYRKGKDRRLLPHCDKPEAEGLEVVYRFGFQQVRRAMPKLVFSSIKT